MIAGLGIDIIDVKRVKQSLETSRTFRQRVFSENEIAYCEKARGNVKYERYAVRFAAKEAFLKACGTGIGKGFNLNEISVVHDRNNRPGIELCGVSKETFEKEFGGPVHLSLSHLPEITLAAVIIESN